MLKKVKRKAEEKRKAVKEAEICLNQLATTSQSNSVEQRAFDQTIEMEDNDSYDIVGDAAIKDVSVKKFVRLLFISVSNIETRGSTRAGKMQS